MTNGSSDSSLSKQPDPSPPEFFSAQPPSLIIYSFLVLFSIMLIISAFWIKGVDWSSLLLNLATEIFGAVILLIIVERKLRVNEVQKIQEYTDTLPSRVLVVLLPGLAEIVDYAKVFCHQVRIIKPEQYVARPNLENLLDRYPQGFILHGPPGIGKSTLAQTIAAQQAQKVIRNPRRVAIPVLLPVRQWTNGDIIQQIEQQIVKYSPVQSSSFREWIKNRKMLLIFDGLDEHRQHESIVKEIETLRKLSANVSVIVTSRTFQTPNNTNLTLIEVPAFSYEETMKQIQQLAGSTESLTTYFNSVEPNRFPLSDRLPNDLEHYFQLDSSDVTNAIHDARKKRITPERMSEVVLAAVNRGIIKKSGAENALNEFGFELVFAQDKFTAIQNDKREQQ